VQSYSVKEGRDNQARGGDAKKVTPREQQQKKVWTGHLKFGGMNRRVCRGTDGLFWGGGGGVIHTHLKRNKM